jgi:hypothetical protein
MNVAVRHSGGVAFAQSPSLLRPPRSRACTAMTRLTRCCRWRGVVLLLAVAANFVVAASGPSTPTSTSTPTPTRPFNETRLIFCATSHAAATRQLGRLLSEHRLVLARHEPEPRFGLRTHPRGATEATRAERCRQKADAIRLELSRAPRGRTVYVET